MVSQLILRYKMVWVAMAQPLAHFKRFLACMWPSVWVSELEREDKRKLKEHLSSLAGGSKGSQVDVPWTACMQAGGWRWGACARPAEQSLSNNDLQPTARKKEPQMPAMRKWIQPAKKPASLPVVFMPTPRFQSCESLTSGMPCLSADCMEHRVQQ